MPHDETNPDLDVTNVTDVTDVTDVTTPQLQALELLMSGESHGNTARAVGVHRQTLWRWRRLPAFAAYEAQQREQAQQRHDELREQTTELLRLSMLSLTRELKQAENDKLRNPLETALKVLMTIRPTT